MTTIFHPDHPHFAVHLAWSEGSFANPDAPPVVECYSTSFKSWVSAIVSDWNTSTELRIKPRTITRTITYPEPLRVAPADGTVVWIVNSMNVFATTWAKTEWQFQMLKNGIVFTTEADAQQCYDALFGEQK